MGWGMDIVPDLGGRIINLIHLCVCVGGGVETLVLKFSKITS